MYFIGSMNGSENWIYLFYLSGLVSEMNKQNTHLNIDHGLE